jgi:tetratricopeptide (TPR) repeat protein
VTRWFLGAALCLALSWTSLARAQQGGTNLRLGTTVSLGVGGTLALDRDLATASEAKLAATPGFGLHLDRDLWPHVALGAALRAQLWKAGDYRDVRAALFDVAPRITLHLDHRDFRLFWALEPGLTLAKGLRNAARDADEPRFGFAFSTGPGVEYWLGERSALSVELDVGGHYVKNAPPAGPDAQLGITQVVFKVGGSFALHTPAQGKPRRDPEADDRRARRLFERGKEAFDHERYARALGNFADAHRLSPRPLLLYNIAAAHDALGNASDARMHYRAFLAAQPSTPMRPDIETRIHRLDDALGEDTSALSAGDAAELSHELDHLLKSEAPAPRARPVHRTWWFWTALGGVVMAGAAVGLSAAL